MVVVVLVMWVRQFCLCRYGWGRGLGFVWVFGQCYGNVQYVVLVIFYQVDFYCIDVDVYVFFDYFQQFVLQQWQVVWVIMVVVFLCDDDLQVVFGGFGGGFFCFEEIKQVYVYFLNSLLKKFFFLMLVKCIGCFLLRMCVMVFLQVWLVVDLIFRMIGLFLLEVLSMLFDFGIMLIVFRLSIFLMLVMFSILLFFMCIGVQWVSSRKVGMFCLDLVLWVFELSRLMMWLELCIDDIFGFIIIIVWLVKYIVRKVFFLMLVGELQMMQLKLLVVRFFRILFMFFWVSVFLLWVCEVVSMYRLLKCLFLIRVCLRVVLLCMMLMKLYIMWCLQFMIRLRLCRLMLKLIIVIFLLCCVRLQVRFVLEVVLLMLFLLEVIMMILVKGFFLMILFGGCVSLVQ